MTMPNPLRGCRAALAAFLLCVSLSGCLSTKFYVDPALPVVDRADLAPPADPKSVNVLFEFRTKGNANARATQEVRLAVVDAVRGSGLFSDVVDGAGKPADGQLKLVIDNVPLTDNAAAKGFGTGLTLGLAGSMVTDGYVCTVVHTIGTISNEAEIKHALHATIGNHRGPEGLSPVSAQEAVDTAVRQMVLNALKQLNEKDAFGAHAR